MTPRIHFIFPYIFLGLMACAESDAAPDASLDGTDATETAETDETSEDPALADIELCDAAEYRPLIGTLVTDTEFEPGARLRVFGVNDIVTQDYIPQRTNVVYDEKGKIMRAYCG